MNVVDFAVIMLAVSGAAMIASGLMLLATGKLSLESRPGEGHVLGIKIPIPKLPEINVGTTVPGLGIFIIGALAMAAAIQLGKPDPPPDEELFQVTGQLLAKDKAAMRTSKVEVVNSHAGGSPDGLGTYWIPVLSKPKQALLHITAPARPTPEITRYIRRSDGQKVVSLDPIDLDVEAGEPLATRPPKPEIKVQEPDAGLPGLDSASAFR